jgi:hypothetical protein
MTGTEDPVCEVKLATPDNGSPGDSAPIKATLTPVWVTGTSPYWLFTGSEAQSIALTPGRYIADVHMTADGLAIQTQPVLIDVQERVTVDDTGA